METTVRQIYYSGEIMKVSEEQVKFGLCLTLIEELNKKNLIKYKFETQGADTIASATIITDAMPLQ